MKKTLSKLLALALTASLVLSGCGGNAEGGNSEANTQGGQANAEGSDKKEEASSKDEIRDQPFRGTWSLLQRSALLLHPQTGFWCTHSTL